MVGYRAFSSGRDHIGKRRTSDRVSADTRSRSGWRAAQPGKQTLRLIFDQPVSVGRIFLWFDEEKQGRTQEFVLRWLPEGQQSSQEIVRQRYTFSLPATNHEIEDYVLGSVEQPPLN